MRMQGTSNEGANAILEEEPVSPVQDLLNLSREPNVSKLVDNVEGNVNGGGDKVVTKLRNGSPSELHILHLPSISSILDSPSSPRFQSFSGISTPRVTPQAIVRKPDLCPLPFCVGPWICIIYAGDCL